MLKYSFACLLLLLAFTSCREEPNYPDEPQISFKRIEKFSHEPSGVKTDTLTFVIGYQDGDGNLGLRPYDSRQEATDPDSQAPFNFGSPYYNNFFLKFYEEIEQPDGSKEFVPFRGGFELQQRFPRISSDEREEPLEGEIRFKFAFTELEVNPGTVMRFEAYIYDRTTPVPHKSNVVISEPVTLLE
ncbi:hypothetical protein H8S95_12695 [Pontibacter sp. KCTC 32443]|nr:hypothetical protein [Pontibacter sp. KCTC 32443]